MTREDLMALAEDLNPDDVITQDDMCGYVNVILDALSVHLDRERVRHGLWKRYGAKEQMRNVTVKGDRVEAILRDEPSLTQAEIDAALEECYDIINYTVFTARILTGQL
jgi:hypothetical protein